MNNETTKSNELIKSNKDFMLSTVDNPFNPFDDFDSWFMFDIEKGYYTCSHLARIVNLTDNMSQKEIDDEISRAIDEIITNDFLNLYIRVFEDTVINVNTQPQED